MSPEHVALKRCGIHTLKECGVHQHLSDHRAPSFGVSSQLDFNNGETAIRFYGHQVGIAGTQGDFPANDHERRIPRQRQQVWRLLDEVMQRLFIREVRRQQRSPLVGLTSPDRAQSLLPFHQDRLDSCESDNMPSLIPNSTHRPGHRPAGPGPTVDRTNLRSSPVRIDSVSALCRAKQHSGTWPTGVPVAGERSGAASLCFDARSAMASTHGRAVRARLSHCCAASCPTTVAVPEVRVVAMG